MPSHYSDSGSVSGSGFGSGPSGPGSSYTERFRADTPYSGSSLHGSGRTSIARLQALIERACSPALREPDLGINLQIADIINEKKGQAPAEAAMQIARLVNSRSTQQAVLAVAVLDVCVKNCGYPFHLQISRKDFLNTLVRGFPEKPPMHYTRIQMLVLECIEEWHETLCRTSKHRDDFGYIRDMHRLLSYKGYMFPEINRDDAAVLNAPETLKSAHELEEEDREAQEAKLQELIRSGTESDLREANHLMSIMAGFRDTKVDYHAKVAKDLDKLRRKGELLEEMLVHAQPGEPLANDDVFQEIVTSLRAADPRLSKIAEDEAEEDPVALEKVDALRNYLAALVIKYDLISKGDFAGAKQVTVESLASGRKIDTSRQGVIDTLIDIDDTPAGGGDGAELIGELGGLSLGGSNQPVTSNVESSNATKDDLLSFGIDTPAPPPPRGNSGDILDIFGGNSIPSGPKVQGGGQGESAAPSVRNVELFSDNSLRVEASIERSADAVSVMMFFSNPSDKKITDLNFEAAPPKSWQLAIDPPSGSTLEAKDRKVSQHLTLSGKGSPKLRWRASYHWGFDERVAEGVVRDL